MSKWLNRFIVVLCILGIGVQIYPKYSCYETKKIQEKEIEEFDQSKKDDLSLYTNMESYNQRIFQENQIGLKDAWSYTQNEFDLSSLNLDQNMFGYVDIPKLGVHSPLYIGASYENLNKGVSVLSQTSMPIGGENTNCVIAGHRGGYNGELFFKDIEQLENGDKIQIINPWDTLTYEVVKSIVIYPNDIDAVKIIEGQDMITLFTCHPYGVDTHRYVVYAQREETNEEVQLPEGIKYNSSKKEIRYEEIVSYCVLFTSVLFLVIILLFQWKYRKSSNYDKEK